ncbi:MAG: Dabb family protein [Clostridia bacterium]|nr:Dabb family protein [Clostridia bacterium]
MALKILKHLVIWRFREEAEGKTREENMRLVADALRALVGVAPTLLSLEVGEDVLHSEQSGDMALVCEFKSIEDMHAYRDFPPHAEISAYIKKVACERRVADFFIER